MSKAPNPVDPASWVRSVSNVASLGASEPSSAQTGNVSVPTAMETVRAAKSLRMLFLP
jgi:hypothetical protein